MHTVFKVNDSPFAGREGVMVTSRNIKARLEKELQHNVALRVEQGDGSESFKVSGRGLLHLGILIENMRREGFELAVGKPEVIVRMVDGLPHEPFELLVIDCPAGCQGAVMSLLGERRAEIIKMESKGGADDYVHMELLIPSRGLFGLHTRVMNATQGQAIMHHSFERYEPVKGAIPGRQMGVIIASETGLVTAYALDALYDRGFFFIRPGDSVYEGQVVGEHCKDSDILANVTRTKQLSNVRAAGKDDAARIRPAREMSLEECLEYIQNDELVEVTPKSIRLRKQLLRESDRRRVTRSGKG